MKRKTTGRKSTITTVLMMAIIALIVVILFQKLTNQDKSNSSETVKTEVQKLIDKDLVNNYPETPREVLKIYLRIMTCLYNEKMERVQFERLTDQMRLLYDEELLINNPREEHLTDLSVEVEKNKEKNRRVTECEIEQGSAVRYYTKDGKDYASLSCAIVMKDKHGYYTTKEKFIFRKDAHNNYKILGWQITDDAALDKN